MKAVVLRQAERELAAAPIAKGLHELRLSYRAGEYRVFYVIKVGAAIYVLHATSKKTQKMDKRITEGLHARLRSLAL